MLSFAVSTGLLCRLQCVKYWRSLSRGNLLDSPRLQRHYSPLPLPPGSDQRAATVPHGRNTSAGSEMDLLNSPASYCGCGLFHACVLNGIKYVFGYFVHVRDVFPERLAGRGASDAFAGKFLPDVLGLGIDDKHLEPRIEGRR